MKKVLLIIALLATLTIGAYAVKKIANKNTFQSTEAPQSISYEELTPAVIDQESNSPKVKTSTYATQPGKLNIEMPFFTQAPHANWDYPWQEACEEASILLVANLYNQMNLNLETFNTELLRLVDWENNFFGSYEHTTVEQTAQMMQENYGLMTIIHTNPSFDDIAEILEKGHLIVAPFAGKFLYNPNFKNGGPNYHMLVIKGYDKTKMQIVTHDVGTRNGENYVYDWSIIEYALHDWDDKDMLQGAKNYIEVIPPTQ